MGSVKQEIDELAAKHSVSYSPSATDEAAKVWGKIFGDEVVLDETECKLLALRRAGVIDSGQASKMHATYLLAR